MLKSYADRPIYYDIVGTGPAILLLHGFSNDHTIWRDNGWVDKLSKEFTVITMDFRGCGKSGKSDNADDYSLEAHCADIEKVLTKCSVTCPIVWGWSLGATVALHFAKKSKAAATIAAGTYFGPIFTSAYVEARLSETSSANERARLLGLRTWPTVQPHEIHTPFLVYTGTRDGNVVVRLEQQKDSIEAAGGILKVLPELNHPGLITNAEAVLPIVWPFIHQRSNSENSHR